MVSLFWALDRPQTSTVHSKFTVPGNAIKMRLASLPAGLKQQQPQGNGDSCKNAVPKRLNNNVA
jgi:hypothetical protein